VSLRVVIGTGVADGVEALEENLAGAAPAQLESRALLSTSGNSMPRPPRLLTSFHELC
jgi:hypothetical protein